MMVEMGVLAIVLPLGWVKKIILVQGIPSGMQGRVPQQRLRKVSMMLMGMMPQSQYALIMKGNHPRWKKEI